MDEIRKYIKIIFKIFRQSPENFEKLHDFIGNNLYYIYEESEYTISIETKFIGTKELYYFNLEVPNKNSLFKRSLLLKIVIRQKERLDKKFILFTYDKNSSIIRKTHYTKDVRKIEKILKQKNFSIERVKEILRDIPLKIL